MPNWEQGWLVVAYDDGWESAMEAAGRDRGGHGC